MDAITRIRIGSHDWAQRHLSAYLEDDLDPLRRRRLRAHLARCSMCRAAYESLVRAVERVRGLGRGAPPSSGGTVEAVTERIRRERAP